MIHIRTDDSIGYPHDPNDPDCCGSLCAVCQCCSHCLITEAPCDCTNPDCFCGGLWSAEASALTEPKPDENVEAVLIAGVHEGADLDLLNDWLASNGLRSAVWYSAGSLVVVDGAIFGSEIVSDEDPSTGKFPQSIVNPWTDKTLLRDVRVPLKSPPPPELVIHVFRDESAAKRG